MVKKVEIDALFSGKTAPIGAVGTGGVGDDTGVDFTDKIHGQMIFSNYNQPLSLQPPAEALNASEH